MADIIDIGDRLPKDPDAVKLEDMEIFEVRDRPVPYAGQWLVDCPTCGQGMNYTPEEDNSGIFAMDPSEWPVCAECGCMFQPADVYIKVSDSDPQP